MINVYIVLTFIFIWLSVVGIIMSFRLSRLKRRRARDKLNISLLGMRFSTIIVWIRKFINIRYFTWMKTVLAESKHPLNISIEVYILMMIIMCFIILPSLVAGDGITILYLVLFILMPMHLIIFSRFRSIRRQLRVALCDIQDIVYFQSKIGTPLSIILANAARKAKYPLKQPLERVVASYRINRNLDIALLELDKASNLMEIKSFIIILKQREKTGFSDENHQAQAIMMKRNKRLKKRIDRELKRGRLLLSAILLFLCYVLMLAGPIVKSMYDSVTKIIG